MVEKEIATKFCVEKDSALSENVKRATTTTEIMRRMIMTSEMEEMEVRKDIVFKYTEKKFSYRLQ